MEESFVDLGFADPDTPFQGAEFESEFGSSDVQHNVQHGVENPELDLDAA